MGSIPCGLSIAYTKLLRPVSRKQISHPNLRCKLELPSQKLYNTAILKIHNKDMAMKTTVIIDGELLQEAMKAVRAKTKRETIEAGLRELVRRKNLEALREELGTFDLGLSLNELERLRNDQ